MSETLIHLMIGIVAGSIGGIAAGTVDKNYSLGILGNTIAGAVGGGLSGPGLAAIAPMFAATDGSLLVGESPIIQVVSQALIAGIVGAIVVLMAGVVKNMVAEHESN